MAPFPTTTADSAEAGAPQKRRRITLACEECRERKRKCDGVKPTCGACKSRPTAQCVWKDSRNSRGWWSSSYVSELQGRIKELEDFRSRTIASEIQTYSVTEPGAPLRNDAVLGESNPAGPKSINMPSPSRSVGTSAGDLALGDRSHAPWSDVDLASPSRLISPLPNLATLPENEYPSPSSSGTCSGSTVLDAMGVVISLHGADSKSRRRPSDFFGPSSTIGLVHQVRTLVGRHDCAKELSGCAVSESCTSGNETCSASSRIDSTYAKKSPMLEMGIPPRAGADRLVNLFRTYVHSLYPFLHWPSFYNRYLALWSAEGASSQPSATNDTPHDYYDEIDDVLFHCMLNVVLALGVLHSPDISQEQQNDISYTFFNRAKRLLDLDMLENTSVALVQVLLLMGQYLQARDISSSCWNTVGLAIRVAQGMGLHYKPDQRQAPDQLEEEMRKRTWSGCILLDRHVFFPILSLTYGRPLMIHSGVARILNYLPSAIDDELLTRYPNQPGHQPDGTQSRVECYIQALRLQHILGQILTSFYHQSSSDKMSSEASDVPSSTSSWRAIDNLELQKLLEVDMDLDCWRTSLPPRLQVSTYSGGELGEQSTVFCRQAILPIPAFMYVRMVLLRPFLSELCKSTGQSGTSLNEPDPAAATMRQGLVAKAGALCVSVAQGLIRLISEWSHRPDLLPPPWYNVLYVYGSALVLFLGSLCSPRLDNASAPPTMDANWKRCLSFLRGYTSQSRSAPRCIAILELFERQSASQGTGKL
ncbi:hypothetical protein K491DRAFT_609614 [Lophiostoma macrostomum CBS 122681]|uniref:Zn(2)-C6 fungal-type domain-containing protein n=1 Tax=Lophiostoma macrostomum CBS 122681 TaxID=1314788 RepID=A0A6A6SUB6_9PLEO|nr:hypothetical protein K491DRAFT_609614 [Lophiostoma macrostomum CBS 122681]